MSTVTYSTCFHTYTKTDPAFYFLLDTGLVGKCISIKFNASANFRLKMNKYILHCLEDDHLYRPLPDVANYHVSQFLLVLHRGKEIGCLQNNNNSIVLYYRYFLAAAIKLTLRSLIVKYLNKL